MTFSQSSLFDIFSADIFVKFRFILFFFFYAIRKDDILTARLPHIFKCAKTKNAHTQQVLRFPLNVSDGEGMPTIASAV